MRRAAAVLVSLASVAAAAVALAQGAPEESDVVTEACRPAAVGAQVDGTTEADTLTSAADRIERVFGLGGDDILTAAGPGDCLFGGAGGDTLSASLEGSNLYGEAGDDRLTGSDGDDIGQGGAGDDVVGLGEGRYDIGGGGAGDDELSGGPGVDNLAGDAGNDEILGGPGDDILDGARTGDGRVESNGDLLRGSTGDDTLTGRRGDRLEGGPGNDRLTTGAGAARADGGSGDDRIKIRDTKVVRGGPGNDRITSRDGKRQRIDCGPGRDTVTADRKDRFAGCEKVKLPPKPVAVGLSVFPASGTARTRFTVSFTSPFETDGLDGSSYTIEAAGASPRCSTSITAITARRRQRKTERLDPPARGWCAGSLRIRLLDEFADPSSSCDSGDECAESTSKVLGTRLVRIG